MKLSEFFEILNKSNELQELLVRNTNRIRVEFYKEGKKVKGITTESYSLVQDFFREEFRLGMPIYKVSFNQTWYNDIFQSYFQWNNKDYYIELTIITR